MPLWAIRFTARTTRAWWHETKGVSFQGPNMIGQPLNHHWRTGVPFFRRAVALGGDRRLEPALERFFFCKGP